MVEALPVRINPVQTMLKRVHIGSLKGAERQDRCPGAIWAAIGRCAAVTVGLGRPRSLGSAALLLFLGILAAFVPLPARAEIGPAARLMDIAPAGWRLTEPVQRYRPLALYEKLDGAAELYLMYNIRNLTFAGFESKNDKSRFLDLFIFDMGNPTNAFGVFSAERLEGQAIPLGRAAYRSEAHHFVWKGRFYLKVISSQNDPELERLSLALARQAADFLPDDGTPVWGLDRLPSKDQVPDSVKYFKTDALGLGFMQDTYTARYRTGGAEVTLFLSRKPTEAEARQVEERYAQYASTYGQGSEIVNRDGMKATICDMKTAFDAVFRQGRLVAGVFSAPNRALALSAASDLYRWLAGLGGQGDKPQP